MTDRMKSAFNWMTEKLRGVLRFLAANNPNFVVVEQKLVTALLTGLTTWLSTKLPELFPKASMEAAVAAYAPAIVIAIGVWIAKAQNTASAKRKVAAVAAGKVAVVKDIISTVPMDEGQVAQVSAKAPATPTT